MIGTALVVGASGYVGGHVLAQLGSRGVGTYSGRPRPGLLPFNAVHDSLQNLLVKVGRPVSHVFIPYGAANPELCASDPVGTMETNIVSTVRLIEAAQRNNVFPVFFSTDYVFDGLKGGFREGDPQRPGTSYGAQKTLVENWLTATRKPHLIARLSKVVGPELDTHSVLGPWITDIRANRPQRCATDQVFSPAAADDIARAVVQLADRGETGIWHVAGPEPISRYDLFALLLEEARKVDPAISLKATPCSLNDIGFLEPRPLQTWMNTDKLQAWLGWAFKPMREVCAETARQHFGQRLVG